MKKKTIILFLIFISGIFYCQNITCLYELRFKSNPNKDSLITSNFYLDIYGNQSIFRSEVERKTDSLIEKTGLGYGRKTLFITDLYSMKDMKTNDIQKIIITPAMKTRFNIKINDELKWQIKAEKQKIGELDCQKAELDYGGRHWIAWFSESINLHEGPYIFHGLPGLIIKLSDSKLEYNFNLIQLKNSEYENLYIPKKMAKEISWIDFQKIIQNYYDDFLYEVKSSGMKYIIVDASENISKISPQLRLKKHQINIRNNDSNLIERDKAIDFK